MSSAVSRPIGDLETYGARPGDYLLPARSHPIFDSFFGGWQDRHLGGSNYSEKTLFLGWTTIVLALVAVVAAAILGYRRARSGNRDPSPRWRLIGRGHVTELAVVALVAALVSGPGHFHFLGQTVPGPSRVIYAVAPYWRVFSRLFVVVHAAAIALAAIALTIAAHRFKPVAYRAILVIVALGVFVDAMAGTPFRYAYFDYDAAPSGYRWIATQEGVDVVADYPVYPTTLAPDASFATFQPIHGKRLVNPKASPDEGSLINSSVLGLSDPQTVPLLRALGVDLVVVHRGLYSIRPPQGPPPELLLQRESSFVQDAQTILTPDQARRHSYLASWYDMEIYSIASGPAAEVAALPSTGWSWPELNGWATERWMLDHGVVEVMRLRGEATRATVSMSFVAFLAPRNVIISQNGVVLADVDVSSSERTTVTVRAEVGAPLEITPTAPSTRVSDAIPGSPDGRELSVRLLEIDASPSTS
ncbi:MAG TPA: hypothetical protein VM282_09265 [Acidimicrobiales bacterium]|nr:hypothetical protein [Acidimicrobiales bacterium]